MENKNQFEKTKICIDIANRLKNFKNEQNISVNLFNENYTFVPKLKKIFQEYIKGTTDFKGTLEFEELGKIIIYHFSINKKAKFIIKLK